MRNGRKFPVAKWLELACRVCPSGQHPEGRMFWSQLAALCDFQNLCVRFRKLRFFLENRKNSVSSKMSIFFNVLQCDAPSCSHAHKGLIYNLVNENTFLKKMRVYVF